VQAKIRENFKGNELEVRGTGEVLPSFALMLGKAHFKSVKGSMEVNQEQLEQIAERFRLLGEPMRLRILAFLRDGERNVNELVAVTGGGQANISRHLSALRRAGVLARRKEGTKVFYRISDDTVYELCRVVCRSDQQLSTAAEVF
jgi:DNA-binding transcriptional ArsR family regulator